jgi:hypothetical protein
MSSRAAIAVFSSPSAAINAILARTTQDLFRDTVATECLGKCQANRPPGGAYHDRGDDAEPGMVIHSGDDLAFGAIDQHQAADNVDLPQRHGRLALPAPVVTAFPPPAARLDQAPWRTKMRCTVDFPGGVLPSAAVRASS